MTSSQKPSKKGRTRLNWDHIYNLPWPVTLTTRRSDLKLPSTHVQILEKILEPAPGPFFILGIHLCGILSIKAVETFNRGPKCDGRVPSSPRWLLASVLGQRTCIVASAQTAKATTA